MAKPLPTPQEEQNALLHNSIQTDNLCSQDHWSWQKDGICVTPDIWAHMLDLIYTSHSEEAWQFLDRAWKGNQTTKQWFIYDFKRRLVSSPYSHGLPVDLFGFESVENNSEIEYLKTIEKLLNGGRKKNNKK